MISHGLPDKLWERAKLHMTSSFFFSNNISTLPNDKIVGRSKLEAFAEGFKLTHELFSVMIGQKTVFKRKKKNAAQQHFLLLYQCFFKAFRHQSASLS